ncbi:UNVERIFIED_CONTAM: hypothetical protein PYX00_000925 [Menopon gallinae]|uniref:E3 ubiquitin-protein ligase APD1-4 middle domain-containing protein n=1 Tax=Menopon gallinae TaxID=328185 RepID=A0AAW2ICZ2_9NEOP
MCVIPDSDKMSATDGQHRISLPLVRYNRRKESTALKGSLRVFRLCLLSILLPGLLIAGPLYLRYRVFSEQIYPLGMSDMRLVDNKISTTWCQSQLVKSNATFSAYLLPEEPQTKPNPVHVSMIRYLNLEDDMKEYWGFYLLKGSSVTVSTCCRWPGASLIVIKGHRHLRECAYIGDDSSEEMEELEELKREKDGQKPKSSDAWPMKKARPSIEFHGPASVESAPTDAGTDSINTTSAPEPQESDSEEVYKDLMNQIAALGDRSPRVMSKLKEIFRAGPAPTEKSKTKKREITLEKELNREDHDSDAAEEEGLGTGEDIRGTVNGTTANDMSNSEFWSSFSSSEERLLSCAGLILNLPLTPSKSCNASKSENTQAEASLSNKLTYKVPANGYYFFVFSSENEVQTNYIRIHFHLEKILYNVSNPVAACTNTTDSCSLPLNFFSREKVVLEMPVNANDSLWNQEYVVVSTCEPRTMVYAACVIAVPILILLFAF